MSSHNLATGPSYLQSIPELGAHHSSVVFTVVKYEPLQWCSEMQIFVFCPRGCHLDAHVILVMVMCNKPGFTCSMTGSTSLDDHLHAKRHTARPVMREDVGKCSLILSKRACWQHTNGLQRMQVRHMGRLGRPLPDAGAQVRGGAAARVRQAGGGRAHLPRPQACALVSLLRHRPGRGRTGISRGPHLPQYLCRHAPHQPRWASQ